MGTDTADKSKGKCGFPKNKANKKGACKNHPD